MNFIRTSDDETFQKLIESGFTFISKENGMFVFLNDSNVKFEDKNMKINYTNIACM